MHLLSAFGGGLFVIPLLFLIGIIVFTISGIKSSKSGSKQQVKDGRTIYSDENIPFAKTWQAKFVGILVLALIAVIVWMINDK